MNRLWKSCIELAEQQTALFQAKPAYIFLEDGERAGAAVTYESLNRRAKALATRLRRLCRPGDRALLVYPSCIENMVAFFAALYAGVIAVPVCLPRRSKHIVRLEKILMDCGARVALCCSDDLPEIKRLSNGNPILHGIEWLASDDVNPEEAEEWKPLPSHAATIAYLQYTSGSTGSPKGVVISQANLLYNLHMIQHSFKTSPDSPVVTWLPIFHDLGLVCQLLHAFHAGTSCVFMAPLSFVQQPFRWLRAMSIYRGEVSAAPDFSYRLCVERVSPELAATLDLSSWRIALNGAEPVRQSTIESFAARFACSGFKKKAFYPAYGMAEATLLISGGSCETTPIYHWVDKDQLKVDRVLKKDASEPAVRAIVGCGKAILDEEIAIVNPATLVRCSDDHIGEIWVAGRNVASGYWNHCEETRETFCGRLVDDDAGPFLRTGDLGFLHEGELFITGRLKDIIILNGVKHYPQDIEAAAEEASADVQPSGVAAFTVGEGRGEHVVVVAEVRRPLLGHEGLQQLAALIRHTVSESCEITVQDVVLICRNTLPKTTSAKVERRRCRDMYLAGCLQRYDAATGNHVETFKAGDRNAETLSAKNGCGEQAICEERILDPSVMHQRV